MNNIEKRGRGRPKGSCAPNVVEIELDELIAKLGDTRKVIVSRTWLQSLDKSATVCDATPAPKIEFNVS